MTASTSPSTRTRQPTAKRREAIIDAAANLFREVGYGAASIDAIAGAVGITGPGIYRHFKGKSAILVAVIERAVGRAKARLEINSSRVSDDPPLKRIASALVDLSLDPANSLDLIRMATQELTEADRSSLAALGDTVRDLIARTVSTARPKVPQDECRLLAEAALGVVGHVSTNPIRSAGEIDRFCSAVEAVLRS